MSESNITPDDSEQGHLFAEYVKLSAHAKETLDMGDVDAAGKAWVRLMDSYRDQGSGNV